MDPGRLRARRDGFRAAGPNPEQGAALFSCRGVPVLFENGALHRRIGCEAADGVVQRRLRTRTAGPKGFPKVPANIRAGISNHRFGVRCP